MKRALFAAAAALALCLLLPASASCGETVFFPLDVYIDGGDRSLAACQFEVLYDEAVVTIVGIEGGEGPFAAAPYYDPAGMKAGRIVIAAFTTRPDPPRGKVRVARLHLLQKGEPDRDIAAVLVLAAGPDGEKLEASIELLSQRRGQDE